MGAFIDLTDRIFNRLTVLNRTGRDKNNSAKWLCKCECGNTCEVASSCLISQHTKSCGCLQKDKTRKRNQGRPYEWLYTKCIHGARQRQIDFALTYEDFLEFAKETKCGYCFAILVFEPHRQQGHSSAHNIDRKHNDIGYTKENCIACCFRCNKAKSNVFTFDEWYQMTECLRRYNEKQ